MEDRIRVFPGRVAVSHPTGGPVRARGSLWPNDGFTARRIADGDITNVPPDAHKEVGGTPGVGVRRDVGETRQEIVDRKIEAATQPLKK